jgi:hypothetical protein
MVAFIAVTFRAAEVNSDNYQMTTVKTNEMYSAPRCRNFYRAEDWHGPVREQAAVFAML